MDSVGYDYLFSLPQADQDAYFADEPDDTVDSPSATDIPPALDLFMGAPYIFGGRYVALLRDIGGAKQVNHAFVVPPTSEEEIIIPSPRYRPVGKARVGAEAGPRREAPRLRQRLGALSLYLVLAFRLDPMVALSAAKGGAATNTLRSQSGAPGAKSAYVPRSRATQPPTP